MKKTYRRTKSKYNDLSIKLNKKETIDWVKKLAQSHNVPVRDVVEVLLEKLKQDYEFFENIKEREDV